MKLALNAAVYQYSIHLMMALWTMWTFACMLGLTSECLDRVKAAAELLRLHAIASACLLLVFCFKFRYEHLIGDIQKKLDFKKNNQHRLLSRFAAIRFAASLCVHSMNLMHGFALLLTFGGTRATRTWIKSAPYLIHFMCLFLYTFLDLGMCVVIGWHRYKFQVDPQPPQWRREKVLLAFLDM